MKRLRCESGGGMHGFFWNTLRKSLLIVLAMSLIMSVLCAVLISGERASRAAGLARDLQDGLERIQSQMTAMQSALHRANANEHVMRLLQIARMERPHDYYRMRKAQEYVQSIGFANVYVLDTFLMFQNAGVVLTQYASFPSFDEFAKHYSLDCFADICSILDGAQHNVQPSYLPEFWFGSSFTQEGKRALCQYFSVSATPGSNEVVAFVLYDASRFAAEALPVPLSAGGRLEVFTASGMPLFAEGEQVAKEGALTVDAQSRAFRATLSLPARWVWAEMDGLVKQTLWFLAAALAMGVFISVAVARVQARPVQKLLQAIAPDVPDADKRSGRTLAFVREEVLRLSASHRDAVAQLGAVRETLRQTMVDRLLLMRDMDGEAQAYAQELPGGFPARFCVCVGRMDVGDAAMEQAAYMSAIRSRLPEGALFHAISGDAFAIILPCKAREEALEAMRALAALLAQSPPYPVRVAVSHVAEEIDRLRAAFEEAHMALLRNPPDTQSAVFAAADETAPVAFGLQDLQWLYRAVMSADEDRARMALESAYAGGVDLDPQSLYYALGSTLQMAARDGLRGQAQVPGRGYTHDPRQQLAALLDMTHTICAGIDREKKSHNEALRKGIMAYIHARYTDPDTYGATIAEHFHISVKYLYNFIKEQAGCSLGEYLMALRLGKACELLKDPSLPIGKICVECGFLSQNTFYKAFKRAFGLSPSAYRAKSGRDS